MINKLKNKIMKNLKFEKESDGKWYVVLPEWEGAHNELEMVAGADFLLDYLSKDKVTCELNVSEEPLENAIELVKDRNASGGAVYMVKNCPIVAQVWLCHVTKFVYDGRLPDALYFIPN
jgi:hypothetical protein